MTMPEERTRSLRFGWEYLMELRQADNLTEDQSLELGKTLRHFPSAVEIEAWAIDCAGDDDFDWLLQPEEERPYASKSRVPEFLMRGPIEPYERARAIRLAAAFVKKLRSADNLNKEQKRQIEYVLRHFPDELDIEHWVRMYQGAIRKQTNLKVWLSKEPG